jgi:hypothetical protein
VGRRLLAAGNAVRLAFSEPLTVVDRVRTAAELRRLRHQSWSASHHRVEPVWHEAVHGLIGTTVPCDAAAEFVDAWNAVKTTMTTEGARIGERFDADVNLSRAIWCAIRHLRPARVVETGVARGVTSWIVLEALARNGTGHLWSIDLPNLAWAFDAGHAVPARLRTRWTYLRGASTRLLPRLVDDLGSIEVFIHDSLHTEANVRFELETVWPAVTEGGVLIVDDIDDAAAYGAGRAFTSFVRDRNVPRWLVGPQDQKEGCFGVIAR